MPATVGTGLSVPTDTSPMTKAGAIFGTVQYMAPEQIEGRPADARTDIFAFGALLYEVLTGRRAFEGASTAALMAAIFREDPPPVLPPEVGRVVRRCLAKDPIRRYQSARDLLNDLEEAQQSVDAGRLEKSRRKTPSIIARCDIRCRGRSFRWDLGVRILAWNSSRRGRTGLIQAPDVSPGHRDERTVLVRRPEIVHGAAWDGEPLRVPASFVHTFSLAADGRTFVSPPSRVAPSSRGSVQSGNQCRD